MGYTHYFTRPATIPNIVWDGIRHDVDKLAREENLGIIVNGDYIRWGAYLEVVRVNNVRDYKMDFLKTRGQQPADKITIAIAAILKTRLGDAFIWDRDPWDGTQPKVSLGLELFHKVFPSAKVPNWK